MMRPPRFRRRFARQDTHPRLDGAIRITPDSGIDVSGMFNYDASSAKFKAAAYKICSRYLPSNAPSNAPQPPS